jgi:hypothetical protein
MLHKLSTSFLQELKFRDRSRIQDARLYIFRTKSAFPHAVCKQGEEQLSCSDAQFKRGDIDGKERQHAAFYVVLFLLAFPDPTKQDEPA